MAEADRLTIASGVSGASLMDRAGLAVADAVARLRPAGSKIAVVCGPGNNGGDGFVAARVLVARGFRVELGLLGDSMRLSGDAAGAAMRWTGATLAATGMDFRTADLIVDAMFGAGLSRDLDGDALAVVQAMTSSGKPVLAVDVPSGLDGTTGQVRGGAPQAV